VKFAPAIIALGCKKSVTKNCGYRYYEIPKMSEFDVPRHLGIVSPILGQLLDSCRDSLNPLPEPDRDSRDSLDLINTFSESSLESGSQKIASLIENASLIEEVSSPTIPTIPNVEIAMDSDDSQLSPNCPQLSPNCPQLSQPSQPRSLIENSSTPEISIDIVQAETDSLLGWEECDKHQPYPNPKSDNIRSSQKRALNIRQAYRAATCKEELAALKNTKGGSYSEAELLWVVNWLQSFFPTEYQYVVATAKISQPSLFPE
jgi:hypothetical protein